MGPHAKIAIVSAAKWAFGLSAGVTLGPIVMGLVSGTGVSGEVIVEKLAVGVALLPIFFFGLWAWGAFSNKDPMTGVPNQSSEPTLEATVAGEAAVAIEERATRGSTPPKKPGRWNYIGIGVGIFMLQFLFLPQLINGTIGNHYYLGAAFWVGVIIYSSINLSSARQRLRA